MQSVPVSSKALSKLRLDLDVIDHPLSKISVEGLYRALDGCRVQEKHLMRYLCHWLAKWNRFMIPCNLWYWNTLTRPRKYKWDPDWLESKCERLVKRYHELHPKRRHCVDWKSYVTRAISKSPELTLLQKRLNKEYRTYFRKKEKAVGDSTVSSDSEYQDLEHPRLLSIKIGNEVPPHLTSEYKMSTRDILDTFPDSDPDKSDQTESDCASEGCQVCFGARAPDSDTAEGDEPSKSMSAGGEPKSKRQRIDPPSQVSTSKSNSPKVKLCSQIGSTFKLCKHDQQCTNGTQHLLEFDHFIAVCATVTDEAMSVTSLKELWAAYRTWSTTAKRVWLIPERMFAKCARIRFCVKQPKNVVRFYGVRLY